MQPCHPVLLWSKVEQSCQATGRSKAMGKSREETNGLLLASIRSEVPMRVPPGPPKRIDSATMQHAVRLARSGPPEVFALESVDRDNGLRRIGAAFG